MGTQAGIAPRRSPRMDLTAAQQAEAQRLLEALLERLPRAARCLAELLASKADAQFLGKTEFEVRDAVHRARIPERAGRGEAEPALQVPGRLSRNRLAPSSVIAQVLNLTPRCADH